MWSNQRQCLHASIRLRIRSFSYSPGYGRIQQGSSDQGRYTRDHSDESRRSRFITRHGTRVRRDRALLARTRRSLRDGYVSGRSGFEWVALLIAGPGERFYVPKPVKASNDDSDSSDIEQLREFRAQWRRENPEEIPADPPTASSITFGSPTRRVSVVDLCEAVEEDDEDEAIQEVVPETDKEGTEACTSTPPAGTRKDWMESFPIEEALESMTMIIELVSDMVQDLMVQ